MTPEILLAIASFSFLVQAIRLVWDPDTRVAPSTAYMTFAALVLATIGLAGTGLHVTAVISAVQALCWLWLALFGETRAVERGIAQAERLYRAEHRVRALIRLNHQLAARAYAPELVVRAGDLGGELDPSLFIPGTNQLRRSGL